jgi:hypothetical protein
MFPMLVPFVAFGNMLGSILGTLGIHWEVNGAWMEDHGNLLGTWWKLSRTPKSKKFKTISNSIVESSPKINKNQPYSLNPHPKVLIKVELETVGE